MVPKAAVPEPVLNQGVAQSLQNTITQTVLAGNSGGNAGDLRSLVEAVGNAARVYMCCSRLWGKARCSTLEHVCNRRSSKVCLRMREPKGQCVCPAQI